MDRLSQALTKLTSVVEFHITPAGELHARYT